MTGPAANGPVYAGFWIRVFASLVDSVLIAIVVMPFMRLIYGPAFFAADAPLIMGPAHVLFVYVLPAIAVVVFWTHRQATPGKMVVGARVVDADTGERPSTRQCLVRYAGYFLSSFVFGLGLIWVGIDRRKQGWHDKLAGTVVVRCPAGSTSAANNEANTIETDQPERWQA